MPPKRKSTVTVKTEGKPPAKKVAAKPAAKKPAKRAAAESGKPKRAKKPRVNAEPGPRTLALPPPAATISFASGAPRAPVRTGEVRVGPRARFARPIEKFERLERNGTVYQWDSEASGAMTMQWTAVDEPCRFVGSRTLEFSLPSGTDASSVVKKLCRGVKATRKETQRHYGPVNYDNDGEAAKPNDGVTTTVRRLEDDVAAGKILAQDDDAATFLASAASLASPAQLPKNMPPCLKCLCYVTKVDGADFSVEIRAYATRVLFYLIADPSVRNVLNGLTTLAGPVTPRASPPTQLDLFATSSQNGSAAPFTLEGVMRSAEHTGCAEDPQPSRIALPMKPYQLQAISWMRQMEGLNLNSLFWEKRAFSDGGEYWFAPDLGECRLEEPPTASGGLLCDEMGMGKTVELLGLVCAAPATVEQLKAPGLAKKHEDAGPLVASRATLIVVPPALVSQWVNEVKKSILATNPLSVKVFVTDKEREELVPLRKGSLKKSETFFASRKQSLSRLADHDIVIVTYNTMLAGGARQGLYGTPGDVNPIEQIRWTRVAVRNQPVRRVHPTTLH